MHDCEVEVSLTEPLMASGLRACCVTNSCSSLDDEDELLYGETQTTPTLFSTGLDKKSSVTEEVKKPETVKPTYWAALARENGVLEVWTFVSCFAS